MVTAMSPACARFGSSSAVPLISAGRATKLRSRSALVRATPSSGNHSRPSAIVCQRNTLGRDRDHPSVSILRGTAAPTTGTTRRLLLGVGLGDAVLAKFEGRHLCTPVRRLNLHDRAVALL